MTKPIRDLSLHDLVALMHGRDPSQPLSGENELDCLAFLHQRFYDVPDSIFSLRIWYKMQSNDGYKEFRLVREKIDPDFLGMVHEIMVRKDDWDRFISLSADQIYDERKLVIRKDDGEFDPLHQRNEEPGPVVEVRKGPGLSPELDALVQKFLHLKELNEVNNPWADEGQLDAKQGKAEDNASKVSKNLRGDLKIAYRVLIKKNPNATVNDLTPAKMRNILEKHNLPADYYDNPKKKKTLQNYLSEWRNELRYEGVTVNTPRGNSDNLPIRKKTK